MSTGHLPPGVPYRDALILMACAQTKTNTSAPAYLLYDGPMWRTLRANVGTDHGSFRNVFVLSAKYGLVRATTFLHPYDELMTAETAARFIESGLYLHRDHGGNWVSPFVTGGTIHALAQRQESPFKAVIIAGSGEYRRGFDWLVDELKREGIVEEQAPVVATAGGIGQQRHQLASFIKELEGLPTKSTQPTMGAPIEISYGRHPAPGLLLAEVSAGRDADQLAAIRAAAVLLIQQMNDDALTEGYRQPGGEPESYGQFRALAVLASKINDASCPLEHMTAWKQLAAAGGVRAFALAMIESAGTKVQPQADKASRQLALF